MEAVIYSFLGICLVSVSLRCYTMLAILKRFSVEDYLAVVAMVRQALGFMQLKRWLCAHD